MDETKKGASKVKETGGSYDIPERYEIIGGIRYDFPSSPKYAHQKVLQNLYLAFHGACSMDGEIMIAPLDVHFDEENILQPDLIYIAHNNLDIIRNGFIFGVPDLVVEILSESTESRDKTIKKSVYKRYGVKEYWLIEPIYRTVDQFVLDESGYRLAATMTEADQLASSTVPCLRIDLSGIFPDDNRQ
ncbi:Uma2 family endonuclease [Paenibacillaceae bacterium WGS1546]|uniref:Uma2 family endonuclease n=1 Tax=Cohnella sp. WGS1546 TaxID=3366810 RepID=UPI00372CF8E7